MKKTYKNREWHALYNLAIWKKQLRPQQLRSNPLCAFCLKRNIYMAATTVDHIVPHKGNLKLFSDPLNLQSLCTKCHSSIKQQEENEKYGYSILTDKYGMPIDPRHPSNAWNKKPHEH